jgi:hypothetical protein
VAGTGQIMPQANRTAETGQQQDQHDSLHGISLQDKRQANGLPGKFPNNKMLRWLYQLMMPRAGHQT